MNCINTNTAASTDAGYSSIALKRQGKLPEQLKPRHYHFEDVPSIDYDPFEFDLDFSDDEEDFDIASESIIITPNKNDNEDELSLESPTSDTSFSSSSSSGNCLSADTSEAPDSEDSDDTKVDDTFSIESNSPPPSPTTPSRIVVTDCDLPRDDILSTIEMTFSTIKTHLSWPTHTRYWEIDTLGGQANRLPAQANDGSLTLPPKSHRGRLDLSVASPWSGQASSLRIPSFPNSVVDKIAGPSKEDTCSSILIIAEPSQKSVPGLASRRAQLSVKFVDAPRPAPTPIPATVAVKHLEAGLQTIPLMRKTSSVRIQEPSLGERFHQQERELAVGQCKESITASRRKARFIIDETIEHRPVFTPGSAKAIRTPLRSCLVKRRPKELRSILVKRSEDDDDRPRRCVKNVSFASKDIVHTYERWSAQHECVDDEVSEEANESVSDYGENESADEMNASFDRSLDNIDDELTDLVMQLPVVYSPRPTFTTLPCIANSQWCL